MMFLWVRKWLQPRASSPGLATMHLRLIMSDVERSLQEVQELAHAGPSGTSPATTSGSGKVSTVANIYYAAGVGVSGNGPSSQSAFEASATHAAMQPLQAPHSPSGFGARSLNASATETKESRRLDGKLQRYQATLHSRRVMIARGTLHFNLVRLRSEFQSLFGSSKGTVARVSSDSMSKARGLSMTRGANRGLGVGGGATLGMSMSMGFASPRPSSSNVASTMRKYRLRRNSSANASTMFSSVVSESERESAPPSTPTPLPTNTQKTASTSTTTTTTAVADGVGPDEEAKMELVGQMLAFMQRDESQDTADSSLLNSALGVLGRLYGMVFGAGEELTATTQYGSLSRDIALLESPDFEVSLDRKVCTAARMRATYSCLMPVYK
jgi:hypothetical protein